MMFKMNRRGGTMMSILFAVFMFLFGMLFINFFMDDVTTAKTALQCSSSTISDGGKLMCLMIGSTIPYWIWMIVALCGGIILDRLLT